MAAPSYSTMCHMLGYTQLKKRVEVCYEQWLQTDQTWQMQKQDLVNIIKLLELNEDIQEVLDDSYDKIQSDQTLVFLLSWMQYILFVGAHPSDWLIPFAPKIDHPLITSSVFQLITILSLIPLAIKDHDRRGIDEEHRTFNLKHLKGYIQNYYVKHHEVGIENFGWTTYLATLGLIHISSLHFMHHMYSDPFYIFQHRENHQLIALSGDHLRIRYDGQFDGVNGKHDFWFETHYRDHASIHEGYVVNPMGSVTDVKVQLKQSEYELILKPGDVVIDFHIPTKGDYSIEGLKKSFLMATSFFQHHYPEYHYRFFWCTSWLYSPQITEIIQQSSRIVEVAKQGYRLPATPGANSLYPFVFGQEEPDFQSIQPQTSLQKQVIDFINHGYTINAGCFLYPLDELRCFGETPFVKTTDITLHHHMILRSRS